MPVTSDTLIAYRHCSLGASKGYVPHVLGSEKEAVQILREFPQTDRAAEILREHVPNFAQAADWYLKTDFYVYQTPETDFPRKIKPEASIRKNPYGMRVSAPYNVGSATVDVYAVYPYLHKIHGQYEAVYPTLLAERPDVHQWSSMMLRAVWNHAVFRYVFGKLLHSRYFGIASFVERRMWVQHKGLDRIIENLLMQMSAPVMNPGQHCESKKEDGEYRCPLRRSKQCNPICGIPKKIRQY